MKFYSELSLPESGKTCRVYQLTYEDYTTLNKFLQNNIDSNTNQFFVELLEKYTNCKNFTGIDMIAALLFLRIISIGGTLKLSVANTIHQVDLVGLLDQISKLSIPKRTCTFGDITFKLSTPSTLHDSELIDYIHSSQSNTSPEYFLTSQEKRELDKLLTANALLELTDLANNVDEQLKTINVWVIDRHLTISLTDGTAFEFLKLIFKDNLISCQRRLLAVVAEFNLDAAYINSLPLAEVEMLLGIIKEREDAKASQTAPSLPGQPRLPSM